MGETREVSQSLELFLAWSLAVPLKLNGKDVDIQSKIMTIFLIGRYQHQLTHIALLNGRRKRSLPVPGTIPGLGKGSSWSSSVPSQISYWFHPGTRPWSWPDESSISARVCCRGPVVPATARTHRPHRLRDSAPALLDFELIKFKAYHDILTVPVVVKIHLNEEQ